MDEQSPADPRKTALEASQARPVTHRGLDLSAFPAAPLDDADPECERIKKTEALRRHSWRRRQARPWVRAPRQPARVA